MKHLQVGVIGLGVGMAHAETYSSNPSCSLKIVCDLHHEKLAEAKSRWGQVHVTTSAFEVCSSPEIDVVSIASYDAAHAEQVLTALRYGKHVFVEKPLCTKSEQLREIQRLLAANPTLKLGTNLLLRRSPRFSRLKALIREGALGTVFSIETGYHYGRIEKLTHGWRGEDPEYSPVLGGGIHVVDLVSWLLGDRFESVSAVGNRIASANSISRCNDFTGALLTLASGAIVTLTVNFGCVYPHFHPLRVYGTEATFINGFREAELWRTRAVDVPPELLVEDYPGIGKGDLIPSFIDAVCDRGEFEIPLDDMFHALDTCFAIDEAVKTRSTVSVSEKQANFTGGKEHESGGRLNEQ